MHKYSVVHKIVEVEVVSSARYVGACGATLRVMGVEQSDRVKVGVTCPLLVK